MNNGGLFRTNGIVSFKSLDQIEWISLTWTSPWKKTTCCCASVPQKMTSFFLPWWLWTSYNLTEGASSISSVNMKYMQKTKPTHFTARNNLAVYQKTNILHLKLLYINPICMQICFCAYYISPRKDITYLCAGEQINQQASQSPLRYLLKINRVWREYYS